ncbi:MAG: hypothetical protein IPL32_00445 [Chloracidobacterium sp.]|jgi:hypothetical protein|nr:hypothetical protein [Chloracidobacterium sp.]
MVEGLKLNEPPNEIGAAFEQFVAQQRRAASAEGDLSLLLALSQHFIILPLGAWRGVPATTPPTTVKSTKRIKTRVIIENSILHFFWMISDIRHKLQVTRCWSQSLFGGEQIWHWN